MKYVIAVSTVVVLFYKIIQFIYIALIHNRCRLEALNKKSVYGICVPYRDTVYFIPSPIVLNSSQVTSDVKILVFMLAQG